MKKKSLAEMIMASKFEWNIIKFCSDAVKEFMWTKKIKSANEINFWR